MTQPIVLASPRLIQTIIVADNPHEAVYIAIQTTQKPGEFRVVSREADLRGIDPIRSVIVRGFVSQELYAATEFFRQMGAVVLDINYKELKREE